ncbi:hypothetical protein ASD16_13485 [Cellulomonas sp. Root485]|uniref:hypothetical protein n=1 Tax=Cellulomonas sp. Root485 TaxID=1736546 RepID=UPI0006F3A766|nr:hypothetical protein [Cellulomonas sp. Root485]KQY23521.1 hypothetical protein ASD16_13485 [Cellulomonas sp. Root485]
MDEWITDELLAAVDARCNAASRGPWRALVEGRDFWGGDTFIQIANGTEQDMYVERTTDPPGGPRHAAPEDLDFIAGARQDIPLLLAEVRRLRTELSARRTDQTAGATPEHELGADPACARCGRSVVRNRSNYTAFEHMHWACFHYEFEHAIGDVTDPDVACADPACPARAFDPRPVQTWAADRELP